jgi:hypothetical protein
MLQKLYIYKYLFLTYKKAMAAIKKASLEAI